MSIQQVDQERPQRCTAPSQGWSVEIHPVRSTERALAACTRDFADAIHWASLALREGFTGRWTASGEAPFCCVRRIRRLWATLAASGVRRNSWKSRSLAKTYVSALSTTSSAEAWRKAAYWSICSAVVSSTRIVAEI